MYRKLFLSLLPHLLVYNCLATPVIYDAVEDDVTAVGSFIREVRQPAPLKMVMEVEDLMSAGNAPKSRDTKKHMKNASGKSDEGGYYRTYGSDGEGEKGYLKETYGKGDHGYKALDTFHKQDGDKYEFETQTNFGKASDDKKEKQHKEKKDRDHDSAGTEVDTDYTNEGGHGEGGEYSHYTGGNDGDHYSGSYSGDHYTEKEPESTHYNYSSGDGNEGSYDKHSSYNSSDGDGDDEGK